MAVSRINEAGLNINQYGNRNLIINGAMTVAQRSTSAVAAGNPNYPSVDRYVAWEGTDGAYTVEQSTDAPTGFTKSLKAQVTTADTSLAAGQYAQLVQRIEAQDLQHLDYGLSTAKTLTLSFWVKSNKTGTYCITAYKEDSTGSASTMLFPKEFSISSANTWENKTITIEPDSQIVSIGSGGGYAQAAATAFLKSSTFSAKKIAQESLKIASGLCIYTNDSISVIEII